METLGGSLLDKEGRQSSAPLWVPEACWVAEEADMGHPGRHWDSTDPWGKLDICPWYPYFSTTCCRPGESGQFMLQTLCSSVWHVVTLLPYAALLNSLLQATFGIYFSFPFFFISFLMSSYHMFFLLSLLITSCCWHYIKSPRDT